ncbi:MAG: hypothetical protein PHV42_04290 [Candidatus Pacebacteria bacterium]|nr:hypothetical protein [Candidatus Paceibacterota bacterium]
MRDKEKIFCKTLGEYLNGRYGTNKNGGKSKEVNGDPSHFTSSQRNHI